MTWTPRPMIGLSRSGGTANRIAYVSLPRKYRPLMNAKTSPSSAPFRDRSAHASSNCAFGERTCFARVPEQFAGDRRNTRGSSDSPAKEYAADREARAHRREQHQAALLQPARTHRVVERERNRRGGGVSESVDVDEDFRRVDAELLACGLDDAAVRLVRHEEVDVVRVQVIPFDEAA